MSSPGPHPFVRATFAFAALALLAACSGGGALTPATQGSSVSQTGHGGSGIPMIAGCQIFPADNPWNTDISSAPVDPNSDNYLSHMNAGTENIEAGFGPDPKQGIPITMADPSTPWVPMNFVSYPTESDPGPYPFPSNARIEGGKQGTGDRHVLVIDQDGCNLFETFESHYSGPGWQASNGARFDLSSNKLRPECWTSADAAGLPIAVPLVKYDEVAGGAINHAMRFTMAVTQAAYVHPATHYASNSQDPNDPPMGLRLRLKASYDLSGITGESLVILTALKKYGMLLADNGSDWDITGATDKRWNETDLQQVRTVPASAFDVIQTGTLYTHC